MTDKDPTAYINTLWFRLLPTRLQERIMARRYWKRVAAPRRRRDNHA